MAEDAHAAVRSPRWRPRSLQSHKMPPSCSQKPREHPNLPRHLPEDIPQGQRSPKPPVGAAPLVLAAGTRVPPAACPWGEAQLGAEFTAPCNLQKSSGSRRPAGRHPAIQLAPRVSDAAAPRWLFMVNLTSGCHQQPAGAPSGARLRRASSSASPSHGLRGNSFFFLLMVPQNVPKKGWEVKDVWHGNKGLHGKWGWGAQVSRWTRHKGAHARCRQHDLVSSSWLQFREK